MTLAKLLLIPFLVVSHPQQPRLKSVTPNHPLEPLGHWVWGKLVNGFVYRAPQTFGGAKGKIEPKSDLVVNKLVSK